MRPTFEHKRIDWSPRGIAPHLRRENSHTNAAPQSPASSAPCRCEALVAMGKIVIIVDLIGISSLDCTSRTAPIPIDEVTRALLNIATECRRIREAAEMPEMPPHPLTESTSLGEQLIHFGDLVKHALD